MEAVFQKFRVTHLEFGFRPVHAGYMSGLFQRKRGDAVPIDGL